MMSIGQASFPANNMTAPTAVRGKFAVDSPLEGAGFEPSVPPANEPQDSCTTEGDGDRSERLEGHTACQGDRWFESCSPQRRVNCEPGRSQPPRRRLGSGDRGTEVQSSKIPWLGNGF